MTPSNRNRNSGHPVSLRNSFNGDNSPVWGGRGWARPRSAHGSTPYQTGLLVYNGLGFDYVPDGEQPTDGDDSREHQLLLSRAVDPGAASVSALPAPSTRSPASNPALEGKRPRQDLGRYNEMAALPSGSASMYNQGQTGASTGASANFNGPPAIANGYVLSPSWAGQASMQQMRAAPPPHDQASHDFALGTRQRYQAPHDHTGDDRGFSPFIPTTPAANALYPPMTAGSSASSSDTLSSLGMEYPTFSPASPSSSFGGQLGSDASDISQSPSNYSSDSAVSTHYTEGAFPAQHAQQDFYSYDQQRGYVQGDAFSVIPRSSGH